MGDKHSCNGDDAEDQSAEHNYLGQSERGAVPLIDRSNCSPDPTAFGRKNFETGALHASRESN